jgi:hypothetical protein
MGQTDSATEQVLKPGLTIPPYGSKSLEYPSMGVAKIKMKGAVGDCVNRLA